MEKYGFTLTIRHVAAVIGHSKAVIFMIQPPRAQTIELVKMQGAALGQPTQATARLTSLILMTSCLLIPIKRGEKVRVAWRLDQDDNTATAPTQPRKTGFIRRS